VSRSLPPRHRRNEPRVDWRKLCHAVEDLESEVTPEGFLSQGLEALGRLVPYDHALAVQTIGLVASSPPGEAEVRRAYTLPFSFEDGKLHVAHDESYDRRLFKSLRAPAGFWDEYFSHHGRAGWKCASVEPGLPVARLELLDWYRSAGNGRTGAGRFVRKHDSRHVLSVSNYTETRGSGFRFCLYRSRRTPFTGTDVATVSALFPHLHNFCVAGVQPEEHLRQRARAAAAAAGLSRREQDVAVLLAERLSIDEISEILFISRHTVEKHVEHIHDKLRASDKREVRLRLLG